MIKKSYGLIFLSIVFLGLLSSFILAVNPLSAACSCNELCGHFKCFSGNCSSANLTFLNCTNTDPITLNVEPAKRCPICPACIAPSTDCVDDNDNFIYSPMCEEYYKSMINFSAKCTQTITGYVKNENDLFLSNSKISLESPLDNISYGAFLRQTNLFDYTFGSPYVLQVPRCVENPRTVVMAASKEGYDSDVIQVDIGTNSSVGVVEANFTLLTGLCNYDCTDSANRCNPDCHGFTEVIGGVELTCDFGSGIGPFYSAAPYNLNYQDIMDACAYQVKGSRAFLGVDPNTGGHLFADCCTGMIVEEERPQTDVELTVADKDMIVIEKPVNYFGEQVILKIFYWDERAR
jgi:hypothetical protein